MSKEDVDKSLHELDKSLVSTISNLKDFQESAVWQDMKAYLNDSTEVLHVHLEKAASIEQIKYIQGQLANCRLILDWPERTIQELETMKEG